MPAARSPEPCLLPAVNLYGQAPEIFGSGDGCRVSGRLIGFGADLQFGGCTEQERNNQTLGERIGQTHGVICPPDVDTQMNVPTPEGGKMPVIPPPGGAGGDPNIQPK
jgi:hypothetical protein